MKTPSLSVCLVLIAAAGCPSSKRIDDLNEVVARQAEAERRLRAENRDLARQVRDLKSRMDEMQAESGRADEQDPRDAKIREMGEQIRRLLAELESAAESQPAPRETPAEVAEGFLDSILGSDAAGIDARVDWDALAEETYRRTNPGRSLSGLGEKQRNEFVSETRKRFVEEFRSGRGREVMSANSDRFRRGAIETGTVRVELGDEQAAVASRWSVLLRRIGSAWKVVGVLNETIEIPADSQGLEDPQGSGG